MMDRKIETYLAKAGMLGLKIAFEEKDDGSIVLERVQAPGLKKYRVPDFVNEIGQQAFARSEELESVLIPSPAGLSRLQESSPRRADKRA